LRVLLSWITHNFACKLDRQSWSKLKKKKHENLRARNMHTYIYFRKIRHLVFHQTKNTFVIIISTAKLSRGLLFFICYVFSLTKTTFQRKFAGRLSLRGSFVKRRLEWRSMRCRERWCDIRNNGGRKDNILLYRTYLWTHMYVYAWQ